MGRPKGGENRRWTTEDRIRIVHRYVDDHIGQKALAKEEGMSRGTLWGWINRYRAKGDEGLKNKKTGNRFSALHTSKALSTEERQQLIIEQQRIEIERLKKGYIVKGVGADKEYVSLKDVNTRS